MSESSFIYSGHEELENIEKYLRNYNQSIVKYFIDSSKQHPNTILDFGAGIGTLPEIWRSLDSNSSIDCVEIDANQSRIIERRGFKVFSSLDKLKSSYEFIYTANVLEHIENDIEILLNLKSVLDYDGKLGIFVPAHQLLFSDVDKKLGHFRRYSRKELMSKVVGAGFNVEKCLYVDCLGYFTWFLVKIFKLRIDEGTPKLLLFYDKFIWPVSALLDALGFKYLFGKNLLLIASKPNSGGG